MEIARNRQTWCYPHDILLGPSGNHLYDLHVQKNGSGRLDASAAESVEETGRGEFTMKKNDFHMLVESIKEASQIKKGKKKAKRVFEMNPPEIKSIREALSVSQREFALMIGVSVRTLQNWEQGRREPEGPAKALLKVASRNPQAVMDALHAE
jgi:putative transcriptional regulator